MWTKLYGVVLRKYIPVNFFISFHLFHVHLHHQVSFQEGIFTLTCTAEKGTHNKEIRSYKTGKSGATKQGCLSGATKQGDLENEADTT